MVIMIRDEKRTAARYTYLKLRRRTTQMSVMMSTTMTVKKTAVRSVLRFPISAYSQRICQYLSRVPNAVE